MVLSRYDKQLLKVKKSKEFIKKLVSKGVPRKQIKEIASFSASYPEVTIMRKKSLYPKGKFGNYGNSKSYGTFNDRNLAFAVKFYKAKQQ